MPKVTTIKEIFDGMPGAFLADKAAGVNAVIQFEMTGDGGGAYYATLANGQCTVTEGVAPNPAMTLSASAADYIRIVNGELNPMQAFMQGKVKMKGDMSLAMKMQQFFKQSG
ncbi:MAG: SCP2 sterol-binding domain-containing protein [Anaerolineales bacterium]